MAGWTPERGLLAAVAIQALRDAVAGDEEALDYLAWWLDVDADRLAKAICGLDRRYKYELMKRLQNGP